MWGSRINGTGYDNRFTLTGTEGRIDVGEFAGDFGPIVAKLWRGTGDGTAAARHARRVADVPDDAAAAAPSGLLRPLRRRLPGGAVRSSSRRVGAGAALEPGLDAGWKTLLVANVAEASSRQDGRVFELIAAGWPAHRDRGRRRGLRGGLRRYLGVGGQDSLFPLHPLPEFLEPIQDDRDVGGCVRDRRGGLGHQEAPVHR